MWPFSIGAFRLSYFLDTRKGELVRDEKNELRLHETERIRDSFSSGMSDGSEEELTKKTMAVEREKNSSNRRIMRGHLFLFFWNGIEFECFPIAFLLSIIAHHVGVSPPGNGENRRATGGDSGPAPGGRRKSLAASSARCGSRGEARPAVAAAAAVGRGDSEGRRRGEDQAVLIINSANKSYKYPYAAHHVGVSPPGNGENRRATGGDSGPAPGGRLKSLAAYSARCGSRGEARPAVATAAAVGRGDSEGRRRGEDQAVLIVRRRRYVVVYFSILYIRYQAGIVTDEMLSLPKAPYLAVGLLEALGAASGMAAAAILSGAAIPILSQSFIVWQLILSYIFLGRRYRFNQLLGCLLVAVGVIVTVASGSSSGSLMEAGVFWSLLMIVSFLFQAADTVLKEIIFLNAAKQLKGRSVDLFVVNSFGSAFQALFICLLLPFLSKLWGIPFYQLPNYLKDGAACFLNYGTVSSGCDGAPLLPLLFVIVNMGFNISLLHLLKISSAVVSCLASTVSVPISVFLFTLPLPYLGVASSLPPGFVSGVVVLLLGMLIYVSKPLFRPSVALQPSSVN
ncbi:hypothetical protein RHGRI_002067 [Rhododendron griersonianum]|uniref:Uncharacterized protein n=1 Tax=Rhododendron griersonianum TaxID=479676 RepID=A0AAV6LNP8_9ERIC|nr:hypothetical protein RHGRI_002067 [Rhododendron griersonianum]